MDDRTRIPEKEIRLAAMLFTLENLGQPRPRRLRDVATEYDMVAGATEVETGESIDEEFQDWLKRCKDQEPQEVADWWKFKDGAKP